MEKIITMTSLSCRFTSEDLDLINDNADFLGLTSDMSGHAIVRQLLDKAVIKKPQTIEVSKKEDQEKIAELQEQLHQMSIALEQERTKPAVEKEVIKNIEVERSLKATEVIIEAQPYEKELMQLTCKKESERTGQEINLSRLLVSMFMEYTKNGPADFFRPLRKSEVIEVLEKYK